MRWTHDRSSQQQQQPTTVWATLSYWNFCWFGSVAGVFPTRCVVYGVLLLLLLLFSHFFGLPFISICYCCYEFADWISCYCSRCRHDCYCRCFGCCFSRHTVIAIRHFYCIPKLNSYVAMCVVCMLLYALARAILAMAGVHSAYTQISKQTK